MLEKFENLRSLIYRILFMVLFFVFAKSCVSDYVNGGNKEKVLQYEQMISDNSFVYAEIADKYTETSIANTIKTYTFNYNFLVDNQNYTGRIGIQELPNNTRKLKLFYLKTDPNIVEYDPWKSIEREKGKGKFTDLIMGIIWGLLFLTFLISFIKLIIEQTKKVKENLSSSEKKEKKKKPIEEETILEDKQKQAEEREKIRKEKEDPTRFMPK